MPWLWCGHWDGVGDVHLHWHRDVHRDLHWHWHMDDTVNQHWHLDGHGHGSVHHNGLQGWEGWGLVDKQLPRLHRALPHLWAVF